MTSYNQSKVSPRKEGKRALQAYSHAKIWCAIMKTLWRVKEVSKSFHSWETKASFTLRCLVQSPGMFLNIQLSFLVVFVKLITHRHQIFFFLVQTLHLCTGRIQDEERGGTWQKNIFEALCQNFFPNVDFPNPRWLHYVIALDFISFWLVST